MPRLRIYAEIRKYGAHITYIFPTLLAVMRTNDKHAKDCFLSIELHWILSGISLCILWKNKNYIPPTIRNNRDFNLLAK